MIYSLRVKKIIFLFKEPGHTYIFTKKKGASTVNLPGRFKLLINGGNILENNSFKKS